MEYKGFKIKNMPIKLKYKSGELPKLNDVVSYISFGKREKGIVKKIVQSDFKEVKIIPSYLDGNMVAVRAKNLSLIKRQKKTT